MAEYINKDDVLKTMAPYEDTAVASVAVRILPSIDLEDYIPIKYVQDFCKDCADEAIGAEAYMEGAGEAIVKSWLAVKDTDFGKKYNQTEVTKNE